MPKKLDHLFVHLFNRKRAITHRADQDALDLAEIFKKLIKSRNRTSNSISKER